MCNADYRLTQNLPTEDCHFGEHLPVLRIYTKRSRPHSVILASCKPGCKPGFQPGLQPGFRQARVGLRHAFDQLLRLFCRIPSCEPQQVCWFVRVLDKCGKNRFKQVHSWLSTCLRPGFRPGLQLGRIIECGLKRSPDGTTTDCG